MEAKKVYGGFVNGARTLKQLRDIRNVNSKTEIKFHVPYLDDALRGISRNDLIVIAAKSGQGKSEISTHIAFKNAQQGKNVYYLALEAEEGEIEMRMMYKSIAQKFFSDRFRPTDIHLDYMDWVEGEYEGRLLNYEAEAEKELESTLMNLNCYYKQNEFDVEDFLRAIVSIKSDADLIIVDHLQYIDAGQGNQVDAYAKLVKKIREKSLQYKIPLILVSHVKKGDKRAKQLVADYEEIFGSSEVYKSSTKTIIIAPCYDNVASGSNYRWLTYFNIEKCRRSGARARYCGLGVFNSRTNDYEPTYKVGKLINFNQEFEQVVDVPFWAKRARQ